MRAVIDVGAASWGGDTSIDKLMRDYSPDAYYGFDPALSDPGMLLTMTMQVEKEAWPRVTLQSSAAWTYDGSVPFWVKGLGGQVTSEGSPTPCFDLARFIHELADTADVIFLKLDCEGAEWELVPHLVSSGADRHLRLALIEWHCAACNHGIIMGDDNDVHPDGCEADPDEWRSRRDLTETMLSCPVERWAS